MSLQIFDERVPELFPLVFDDSNSPGTLQLTPNDKLFRRVDSILVTNNDTIDHEIQLRLNNGTAATWLGSVLVPAGQGFGGTPALDLMAGAFPASQVGIAIFIFTWLDVRCTVALNSGKGVFITALGGTL